jgi:putative peptidoglycan lipid II flippase
MKKSQTGTTRSPDSEEQSHAEGQDGGLLRRSTTVSFFIGLGVVAGFLVDVLIVARFGVGAETDAFFGAYTVPFILVTSLAAIQPVLVTILAGFRGNEAAFSALLNASALAALGVALLGALLARPLIAITLPGFAPATAALATLLAQILFARVPAAAVSEVCKAELYNRHRFGLAAFSSVIPSLVAATLLVLAGSAVGIEAVAWSLVAGALVQAGLLCGALFVRQGMRYYARLRQEMPVLQQTARLVVAPLASLLLRQGVTVAERLIGSFLPAGSVTAITYANRLTMVAAGILFDGATTAALPSLAALQSRGEEQAARVAMGRLLKLLTYVALPAGLTLAALSTPLVRLFFERGQVDAQAAVLMGTVLGVYALSLPFLGPYRAVQTYFYARRAVRPVVILQGSLAMLTIGLDLLLVRTLGVVGLALAFALSCNVVAAIGLVWMGKQAGDLGWRTLLDQLWRLGLATAAMAASVLAASRWVGAMAQGTGRWELVLAIGVACLVGLAVFVGLGAILRLEAISILWSKVKDRWTARTRLGY